MTGKFFPWQPQQYVQLARSLFKKWPDGAYRVGPPGSINAWRIDRLVIDLHVGTGRPCKELLAFASFCDNITSSGIEL